VTKLEKALYAQWLSRFGRDKVKELADGLKAGKTVGEKSAAIVKSKEEDELRSLLLEGFGGFFHQTVYARKLPKDVIKTILKIPVLGDPVNFVVLESVAKDGDEIRCLLMVTQVMEFLPDGGGGVLSFEIPFPVALAIDDDSNLLIHVLTMQSTTDTWAEIVGKPLKRMLTTVRSDVLHDKVLNFLTQSGVSVGTYGDYSVAAIKLIKRADIDTYSGTLGVGTVGETKHYTVRGKGKKPLRSSMPAKFQELISAQRLVNAQIELADNYEELLAGSRIALFPTVGKISFRSNLQGSDPDAFVKSLVG
jgi:hypothetical protein